MSFIKYSIANLELINQEEPEWVKEAAKAKSEESDVKEDTKDEKKGE